MIYVTSNLPILLHKTAFQLFWVPVTVYKHDFLPCSVCIRGIILILNFAESENISDFYDGNEFFSKY